MPPSTSLGYDVSIIVPCRNEVAHIQGFLKCLQEQQFDGINPEILIADGCSDDGTRAILERECNKTQNVQVIDNTQQVVSSGLNAAIIKATSEVILRMDVHTEYARDYVLQCVKLLNETRADNVGGPWRAKGKGWLQRAVALAFQSPFSSGGAGSHSVNYEGKVDSVYLGCWRRQTLIDIGLFDETLVRNQDDELNLRLTRAGKLIWQSPRIQSWYYPRSSLIALFKQYAQYGYWKVPVISKHRIPASIRHLLPATFVATLLLSTIVGLVWQPSLVLAGILVGCYSVANMLACAITCQRRQDWQYLLAMPLVFAAFHFGYGYGFLRGVIDFGLSGSESEQFTALTREQSAKRCAIECGKGRRSSE